MRGWEENEVKVEEKEEHHGWVVLVNILNWESWELNRKKILSPGVWGSNELVAINLTGKEKNKAGERKIIWQIVE